MAVCYILFSEELHKYYVGSTQADVYLRVKKHNEGTYGRNHFTVRANDWKLVLFIETTDYSHAIRIERKIKSMKSSAYIRNLISYPELQERLYSETKQST